MSIDMVRMRMKLDERDAKIAQLRAALEAQLEAHNYAEVLEIARKALKEGK